MRHYSKILVLAALSIALPAAAQTPPPAKKPAPSAKAPAAGKSTPFDPALLHPETCDEGSGHLRCEICDYAGDFTIKVTRTWAPNGADRFYNWFAIISMTARLFSAFCQDLWRNSG